MLIEGTLFVFSSSVFFNGSTIFDGNVGYGTFDYFAQGGAIYMENSSVVIQGTANFTENSIAGFGSGGAISALGSNLYINATAIFYNNSASAGSGGAIHAEVSYVQLAGDVTFQNNQANNGGAILPHSSNLSINATVIFFNNSADGGGAIYAEVSCVQLAGDVTIENNSAYNGGAIHTVGGSVLITGNSSFVSNGAGEGGAMKLEGSTQLVLRSPLVASFYYNEADNFGGAIFNDDSTSVCSNSRPDCFFAEDPNSDQRELHLNFSKNSAPQGGAVIYGGNLEHCFVNQTTSGISFLQNISNIITSETSSDPLKVCICENGTISDCPASHEVSVKRGKLFNISLITVGQLNLSVSSRILASIDGPGSVQLSPEYPFSNNTFTNVGIRVFAYEDVHGDTLQLYPEDSPCDNIAISIEVYLEDCPPGFDLVEDHCDCERRLSELIRREKVKKMT